MMNNKCRYLSFLLVAIVTFSLSASETLLNTDWRFHLGDDAKAKERVYDDAAWRTLRVPHDWAFELGYSQHGAQQDKGGYLSGGIAWYRRTLTFTEKDLKQKNVFIDFEAVYMNSEVWINGHYLGKYPYGYNSFSYELTEHLRVGENTLSVRVDNSLEPSARWYHGCGIYGEVRLRTHTSVFVPKDATFVTTPTDGLPTGEVKIQTLVENRSSGGKYSMKWEILDANRKVLKRTITEEYLSEGTNELQQSLVLSDFDLWTLDNPALYHVSLTVSNAKRRVVDQEVVRFGFRSIDWQPATGFYLNGEPTKLRGVCEHLEGGPTGAFWNREILRWKLQLIKDMGCNAVRVAHNPQVPVFYDLCDEMGILVMDEIFDGWHKKADFDYGMQAYAEWWERDLRAWLRRNRNHPSIFLYSLGNETHGDDAARNLLCVCHQEDPTRKVTSGDSAPALMDVHGVNGNSEKKEFLDNYLPTDRAFIATENPHTWQVRGYYRTQTWYRDGYPNIQQGPQHIPDLTPEEIFAYDWISPDKRRNRKQIFNSSYDNATVRVTARHLIEALRDKSWFSGNFRWTGFDYLGEAGYVHGGWPFRAFQSGAMDLAGFRKDLYYLYQSQWTDKDMVHILPHWTHPRMNPGTEIPVWVYTTGDEVELFQDGISLGRKRKGESWDQMQCDWLVEWREGALEAVAYRHGQEIARTTMRSAGAPTKLTIETSTTNLKADYADVAVVSLTQTDAAGTHYPYGENRQYIHLTGPARVLSFENGSPVDVETNFNATSRCSFMGKNRLFIQPTSTSKQPVSLVVAGISGDKKLGLSDRITIHVDPLALRGKCAKKAYTVRYTTDGSTPNANSLLYNQPFIISPNTTVKAVVFENDEPIIVMQERFGPDEGLYWGTPGEEPCAFTGDQAEYAALTACAKLRHGGDGFYGDAYVVPKPKVGTLTWYQENDGGKMASTISVRYSLTEGASPAIMQLWNNDEKVADILFAPTGSVASHWVERTVPITIYSGANNITLKSVTENSPSIDQITIIQ